MDDPNVFTDEELYENHIRGRILESMPPSLREMFDGVLRFQEAEFRKGLNFTARNGRKWAGRVEEESTVLVAAQQRDYWQVLDVAKVQEVFLAEFASLPQRYVDLHHNLNSQSELAAVMGEIYGEDFTTESMITGITFELMKDRSDE
jgi:hypothetical protein